MRSIETEGAAGAKRQRIGVALAFEFLGAGLCETFDVLAKPGEFAHAGEEFVEGLGACGLVEVAMLQLHPHARDLAGAASDDALQRGLVVEEDGFEIEAGFGAVLEFEKALLAEHALHHLAHVLAKRLGALAHRVGGE